MIEKYNKQTPDGKDVYYEILENGFNIYIGQSIRPSIIQPEPFIPDPSKTYEENAVQMCEDLCKIPEPPSRTVRLTEVEYNRLRSDIDYLLLLNE